MENRPRRETHRSFVELLDRQYVLVENYANAQTRLYNVTATSASASAPSRTGVDDRGFEFDGMDRVSSSSSDPVGAALGNLDDVRWDLRANLEALEGHEAVAAPPPPPPGGRRYRNRGGAELAGMCRDHLALSKRVVHTLYRTIRWHPNGVIDDAVPGNNHNNDNDGIVETGTVAISALNASMVRLKTLLGVDD